MDEVIQKTIKADRWEAITSGVAFTPIHGANGLSLAPKATASGTTIAGTVWGKPSATDQSYRIAGTFSFVCSIATLDADGYTAVMKTVDITGLSEIKVVFTGGTLAYLPY